MLHQYSLALLLLALYVAIATAGPLENKRDDKALCAPGYWCQKKRDTDSSMCPSDFHCSPSANKRDEIPAACHVGYWCRRRRDVIFDETDADSCPPGYWCSKRKRDSAACPPGYWCSKRSLEDPEQLCPTGYWCPPQKNSENDPCPSAEMLCKKESDVIHEDTAENECPEARWCRKRRQIDY